MRRYSAAQARQHFSNLLDVAEQGERVVIERHGTRFELAATSRAPAAKRRKKSLIVRVDPAVARGSWTWAAGASGLTFVAKKRGR